VGHFGMGQVHFDEVHDGEVRGDFGLYGVGMVLIYGDMEQTHGDREQTHGDMEQSHGEMEQSHDGEGQVLMDQRKN